MWSSLSLVCQTGSGGTCSGVDAEEDYVGDPAANNTVTLSCFPVLAGCCRQYSNSTRLAVAVMRHGERLDAVDPVGWYHSAAGRKYPFDCPLSSKGRMQVGAVARELAQQSSGNFSYVVSSPYVRCVETAVEVCRALQLPMCIDRQLGEVFGPACFGEWSAPGPQRRSAEDVAACVPPDLRRLSPVDCIGQEPTWPESIEDARLRMVARVEQYAEWAARLDGVNFVLVTHGDCVGSCLTLALARGVPTAEKVVEKVDYCGYALLERTWDPGEPNIGLMDDTAKWQVMHGHVVLRDRNEPASYAMHRAAGATEAHRKQQQQQQQQMLQQGGHSMGRTSKAAAAAAGAATLLTSQSQLRRSLKQQQAEVGLTVPLGDIPPKAREWSGGDLRQDDLYTEDFVPSGRDWFDATHGVSGL